VGGQRFFDWVHAQPEEYFPALLADLITVNAEDLNEVLRDVDGAVDFKVAQLGGGECAGASQVFIGAAFFAAAHERRYRHAFVAQARDADARACTVAQLRLIAQGLNDLLNPAPSFRVRKVLNDLGDLAEALAAKAPAELREPFARFAAALADEATPVPRALYTEVDSWVLAVAQFCVARDPQLDLTGALPSQPQGVPLRFVRNAQAVAA
jgi:hypothetical protein